MGLFGGASRAATLNTCIWRDTQVVVCRFAQITSGTPLVWHLIEYQRQDVSSCFGSPAKKSSLKQFHGAFFCFFFFFFQGIKLPQAHLLPSALHFHVFSFNSTFRFAILGAFFCFFFLSRYKITPGTSSFSFTFSCFFFQFHLPLCYFELF